MKKEILITLIITILLLAVLFFNPKFTGNSVKSSSYTKAFCNSNNYCKDYYVECSGKEVKSITPTGFAIQHKKTWKDTRETNELNCE